MRFLSHWTIVSVKRPTVYSVRLKKPKTVKCSSGSELDSTDADADETTVSEQPLQQLLFVMQRGQGRNMRQQLEEVTGLTVERNLH